MAATQIKDGFQGGSDNQLKVNSDGSINVNGGGGGGTTDVNIHDSAGNSLTSTSGALNVSTTGSSTVTGTVTSNQAGLIDWHASQFVVGVTATQIAPSALTNRSSISLKASCDPGQGIYVGKTSSVTVNDGWEILNGETLQLDLTPAATIYAISGAANQKLFVIEVA